MHTPYLTIFMELKLPPPILFLLAVAFIYWLPKIALPLANWLSYLFIFTGIIIAIASLYPFYQHKTTINPHRPEQSVHLITYGIYRFSRNPMYLSLVCFLLAFTFWQQQALGFLVIIGFIAYLNRFQIQPEERILKQKFGQDFLQYQQKVRRWI